MKPSPFIFLLFFLTYPLPAEFEPSSEWPDSNVVLAAGRDGTVDHQYSNIREPVAVRTRSGRLVLGAQAGNRHGWPERSGQDLVVKFSDDHGKTWSPLIIAAESGDYSCQCHGMVYDEERNRLLFLYTVYNWDYTAVKNGRGGNATLPIYKKLASENKPFVSSFIVHSNDEGEHWSKPREITEMVGRQAHFGASEGRQLKIGKHKGRLILAGSRMDLDALGKITKKHTGVWLSDDHGTHWRLVRIPIPPEIDTPRNSSSEARVTETLNGTLLYNQRTRNTGRQLSWSNDGGNTWSQRVPAGSLKATQCNGSLLTIQDRDGKLTDKVLFSIPTPGGRSDGVVYLSKDGGKTWPISKNIIKGNFAYSALIQSTPETIVLFYETNHYRDINLIELPIKDLLD